MARRRRLFSTVLFALSLSLFAFALWARFLGPEREGQWRANLVGASIGPIPVETVDGKAVSVSHPALLYFFSSNCRFCPPAAERINQYVQARGTGGIPVYAISNNPMLSRVAAAGMSPPIRVLRLKQVTPVLGFVREVPMLVRTNARGGIERAYVGLADEAVLRELTSPLGAGAGGGSRSTRR